VSTAQRPATAAPDGSGAPDGSARPQRGQPRRRKVAAAAVVVVVLAGAGVGAGLAGSFGGQPSGGGVAGNGAATSLATVTRQSLSSRTSISGTLGYAGSYSVINQAQGTFTTVPHAGQVARQGQVLYRVDGKPVVLLYGPVPAYRALSAGRSGADVRQLNHALVALGYAARSQLDPSSRYFGAATAYALKKLQAHLGVTQTGTLALGQAVFLPGAARVTKVTATLGTTAGPGTPALAATSTARRVSIDLDAAQQAEVKAGDKVTINLPSGKTTPGRVSSVGKVATAPSGSGNPTVPVQVTPLHPAATGRMDQAPVHVSITTATVRNALAVPVNALLALASGGYAVEEVTPRGVHRLVPVRLGIFDDTAGLVQVTGPGLAAGQRVVVPAP
jgi:peptidoglycan hydrolase-like protein with peptidoglycan-binding domain